MSVSIVVPVYNELLNVPLLYEQLVAVLPQLERPWEILFIDDGSTDGSREAMDDLAASDSRVKVVHFRRNYGQTAAMHAGLQLAEGDVIVTLDGDLQNEPADIPMMVRKLDEGYDLVHGWRKNRQDAWLNRKLPSRIANWLISRTTRFPIHDLGCTLKAIRGEIARELELHGEMHRFIPILAHQRGARCVEVVTRHHPRRFGTTKYGISRTLRVVLDLVTVKYMLDYFASPMKLFGMIGLGCGAVGLLAAIATFAMKYAAGFDMTGNPCLLLSVLGFISAIQFISLGLLGEVNARIYYSSQPKQNYAIRELVNFDQSLDESSPRTLPFRRAA
jgi:glycosyltransferase involved in cell wall biosynthesis